MPSLHVLNVNLPSSEASRVSTLLSSVEQGILGLAASSPNTVNRTRVPIGIQALSWRQLSDRRSFLHGLLEGVSKTYRTADVTSVDAEYDEMLQSLGEAGTILTAGAADPTDEAGTPGRGYVEKVGDEVFEQFDGDHESVDGSEHGDDVNDSEGEDEDGDNNGTGQSGQAGAVGSRMTFTQIAGSVLREVGAVAELVSDIVLGIRPSSLEE
jgi:hypothetical protein